MALAGITDEPLADPVEERNVVRDASGHPTGVLIEAAMEAVERYVKADAVRRRAAGDDPSGDART